MTATALEPTDRGRAAAIHTARQALTPGAAVVLDTETTGLEGHTVEIAVLSTSGRELLNTLVRPPVPIEHGAQLMHGITMRELDHAPTWAHVLPDLLRVTAGRSVIAYNASFDAAVIARDCATAGAPLEHLADPQSWQCLMQLRTDWDGAGDRTRLAATHRAMGDCRVQQLER